MARLGQQMSTAAAAWRLRSRSRSRDRPRAPQQPPQANLEAEGPSSLPNQVRYLNGIRKILQFLDFSGVKYRYYRQPSLLYIFLGVDLFTSQLIADII